MFIQKIKSTFTWNANNFFNCSLKNFITININTWSIFELNFSLSAPISHQTLKITMYTHKAKENLVMEWGEKFEILDLQGRNWLAVYCAPHIYCNFFIVTFTPLFVLIAHTLQYFTFRKPQVTRDHVYFLHYFLHSFPSPWILYTISHWWSDKDNKLSVLLKVFQPFFHLQKSFFKIDYAHVHTKHIYNYLYLWILTVNFLRQFRILSSQLTQHIYRWANIWSSCTAKVHSGDWENY